MGASVPQIPEAAEWRSILIRARSAARRNPNDAEAQRWADVARQQLLAINAANREDRERVSAQEAREARDPGRGGALGMGFSQAATAGFGDEAAGALSALGAVLPGGRSPGQAYREERDAARLAAQGGRESHPGYYFAGELAGTAATAVPAVRGGAALTRAGVAAAGSRTLPRIAARIAGGAATGGTIAGAETLGRSEGSAADQLRAARDVAIVGAILGGLAPLAGAAIAESPVARYGRRITDRLAGRSAASTIPPPWPRIR